MSGGGDRKPLMGGNWKLNPTNLNSAVSLSSDLAKKVLHINDVNVVVFPPSPFLTNVYQTIKGSNVNLGGQNCYFENDGAFTGEVSTGMLKDIGAKYILVGHSERRTIFKESDEIIAHKVKKILKEDDGKMIAVLCIGETKEEYESGLNQQVCASQLLKNLDGVSSEDMKRVVIAYEPVWAIGTGLVCPAETAQEVHKFIRSTIEKKYGKQVAENIIIQYGGSVKPDNVKHIMSMPDIDGCLVGGASLSADSFAKIIDFKNQ